MLNVETKHMDIYAKQFQCLALLLFTRLLLHALLKVCIHYRWFYATTVTAVAAAADSGLLGTFYATTLDTCTKMYVS